MRPMSRPRTPRTRCPGNQSHDQIDRDPTETPRAHLLVRERIHSGLRNAAGLGQKIQNLKYQ